MTGLDTARVRIRRRAISEAWSPTALAIAEDLADTAREDGTHALRSRQDQAHRLGVSESTVKRHRGELERLGVLAVRRKGGNGRGAAVVDLLGSGSATRGDVTPDPVTPDQASSGSAHGEGAAHDSVSSGPVAGQSRVTVTPEGDPVLLSPSPKQQQDAESSQHQSARWLAEQEHSDDLAACLAVVRHYASRCTSGNLPAFLSGCWRRDRSEVQQLLKQHASKPALLEAPVIPEHLRDEPFRTQQEWMRRERQGQIRQHQLECARRAGFQLSA